MFWTTDTFPVVEGSKTSTIWPGNPVASGNYWKWQIDALNIPCLMRVDSGVKTVHLTDRLTDGDQNSKTEETAASTDTRQTKTHRRTKLWTEIWGHGAPKRNKHQHIQLLTRTKTKIQTNPRGLTEATNTTEHEHKGQETNTTTDTQRTSHEQRQGSLLVTHTRGKLPKQRPSATPPLPPPPSPPPQDATRCSLAKSLDLGSVCVCVCFVLSCEHVGIPVSVCGYDRVMC